LNPKLFEKALTESYTMRQQTAGGAIVEDNRQSILEIRQLTKTYASGFSALKGIDLSIQEGEIFALLGPNGAGKTTMISIICGIVNPSSGEVLVGGYDILKDFRQTRSLIGLVPQELTTDAFETVWDTVCFSRGLFGKAPNPAYIEELLKSLSLWDKKDSKLMTLSGGMKRRVLIAKALSHEPRVLFLDEPTAGVDVELRKSMWEQVRKLRETGVTIILTTHYIEEAEEMADRIGVINHGQLIEVESKDELVKKLGKKSLQLILREKIEEVPSDLESYSLELSPSGYELTLHYDTRDRENDLAELFVDLKNTNLHLKDVVTKESSLEEIFVELVKEQR